MTPKNLPHRNLEDTPFSLTRLPIWAIGIVMLIGMLGMVVIGYQGKTIPPQIQSAVMVCIGAFVGRIERGKSK